MGLLKWAIAFGILAVAAGLLGFTGAESAFAGIAKILFFVFLLIVVMIIAASVFVAKKVL